MVSIGAVAKRVREFSTAGDHEQAWTEAEPLVQAASRKIGAAEELVELARERCFTPADSADALLAALHCGQRDVGLLLSISKGLEHARDIDMLNAPAPEHSVFEEVTLLVREAVDQAGGETERFRLDAALGSASKLRGRAGDSVAEAALRRCIDARPDDWKMHYDLGLFFKTRGRFAEGMSANQRAFQLGGAEDQAVQWNLGICATGAGQGRVAHRVWSALGVSLEPADGGLPRGGFPSCKLRLAERPLAERDAEQDDPGLEETIWIERLSPCHGIIRSVLYLDLGVDYGDLILFDGAPIAHHTVQDRQVPVFPHLATLERRAYQLFNFAATQRESGQVQDLTLGLSSDAVVYSHTEQFQILCADCWRSPGTLHEHHEQREVPTVRGQIAAPPEMEAADLLAQLDSAVAATNGEVELFCPDLLERAGAAELVAADRQRYGLLEGAK